VLEWLEFELLEIFNCPSEHAKSVFFALIGTVCGQPSLLGVCAIWKVPGRHRECGGKANSLSVETSCGVLLPKTLDSHLVPELLANDTSIT
jgi:hypothetical protein